MTRGHLGPWRPAPHRFDRAGARRRDDAAGFLAWRATGQATTVFSTLALTRLLRTLSARSFHESVLEGTRAGGNRVLVSMLAPAVTLQLEVVYLPGLGSVFVTVPLPAVPSWPLSRWRWGRSRSWRRKRRCGAVAGLLTSGPALGREVDRQRDEEDRAGEQQQVHRALVRDL